MIKVKVKKEYRELEDSYNRLPEEDRQNRYILSSHSFLMDKVYEVIKVEKGGFYRIIDESGEDYMFPPEMFDVVEG